MRLCFVSFIGLPVSTSILTTHRRHYFPILVSFLGGDKRTTLRESESAPAERSACPDPDGPRLGPRYWGVKEAGFAEAETAGLGPNAKKGGDEKGGNQKGGTEKGGNQKGGNETGGNEKGAKGKGGNKKGRNEKGANENGGNEKGGNENGGNEKGANVVEARELGYLESVWAAAGVPYFMDAAAAATELSSSPEVWLSARGAGAQVKGHIYLYIYVCTYLHINTVSVHLLAS